jgi:hypothetical protein
LKSSWYPAEIQYSSNGIYHCDNDQHHHKLPCKNPQNILKKRKKPSKTDKFPPKNPQKILYKPVKNPEKKTLTISEHFK